jgi:hypothetical protein
MRCALVAALLAAAIVSLAPTAAALPQDPEPLRETYLFHVGARALDDDDAWEDLEEHFMLGFQGAFHPGGAGGLGLEYGMSFSADDTEVLGVDVTGVLFEGLFGVRYVFGDGPIYPLVGVGVNAVYADVEGEQGGFTTSDDDTTFGGYAHLGAFWRVPGGFSVGVDGRIATTSDLELFGVDTDADYSQIALTLGWSS